MAYRLPFCIFQSTHPSGVRLRNTSARTTSASDFNPRTPVGCDFRVAWPRCRGRYFNPRTPVGCDVIGAVAAIIVTLFQSTHPSGVRLSFALGFIQPPNFNPRTPVGCDGMNHGQESQGRIISIHAPQWGATGRLPHHPHPHDISIHAPQWGATICSTAFSMTGIFQSTHPSGVRPGRLGVGQLRADFNPRTPVGCDGGQNLLQNLPTLFQSTHPSPGSK